MPAEWETRDSGTQTADTSSSLSVDEYDIDPDVENYANGITPDTPYGSRDNPDDPGGQDDRVSEEHQPGEADPGDGYADDGDGADWPEESDRAADPADEWGDTDPGAENYADLDGPDVQQSPREEQAEADEASDADAGQPGQDQASPAETGTERTQSPEQERISALEAENTDARQQITDANQKIAELEAKNDEQASRLGRIEQLLAGPGRQPASAGGDGTGKPADQHRPYDAIGNQHGSAIAEHKDRQGADSKEAESTRWRRVASAENIGIAGSLAGAADTVSQFAMHATPEGMVGLGATILGLASLGLAKAEKKR